jgi:recombination protein RecA
MPGVLLAYHERGRDTGVTYTPQELMQLVNKEVGSDALRLGSDPSLEVTYVPTGVLPVDILLQGGMPRGRFVECYGDFSTLKSYIGLSLVREYQKRGGVCALIDTERTFEPDWAEQIGIDTSSLVVWPNRSDGGVHTGEEAVDVTQALIKGGIDFVVFDSVAAALPQAEANKRMHDENIQPARLAALMSAAMRRLTATNTHTSIFWVNQTRVNPGISFGSNEAIPGGKALSYYASYRIRLSKVGKVTRDRKAYTDDKWSSTKTQIGQKFKAELTKSKLSKPFEEVWFTWDLTTGEVDTIGFLISQGVEIGLVQQKGNTWTTGDVRAVGREKFRAALSLDADAVRELEAGVRRHHGIPVTEGSAFPGAVVPARRKVLRRRRR